MINLAKVANTSKFAGLSDKGPASGSGSIAAQNIAGNNASISASFDVAMPANNLLPCLRINFGGLGDLSNYWIPFTSGAVAVYGVFRLYITSVGSATGRTVKIAVINSDAGTQAFPGCTVNIAGRVYAYPWQ